MSISASLSIIEEQRTHLNISLVIVLYLEKNFMWTVLLQSFIIETWRIPNKIKWWRLVSSQLGIDIPPSSCATSMNKLNKIYKSC